MKISGHTIGYSLLQQVSSLGFQFAAFLLLVRLLSKADMGEWTLYLTFHAFFETARTGFMHNGLIKYLVVDPAHKRDIFATALGMQVVLGVLASVLFGTLVLAFHRQLGSPELLTLAAYYPLVAIPAGFLQLFQSYQSSRHAFREIWIAVAVMSFLIFCGPLYLWWTPVGQPLSVLIWFQVLGYSVGALILGGITFRQIRPGRWRREWSRKLFHFGKYSMGTSIGSMLYHKTDILMVGFFLGPAPVAIYSVATRINNYMEVPLSAMAQVFYPTLNDNIREGKGRFPLALVQKAIALMLTPMVPAVVLLFFFPHWVVRLLAGEGYLEAAPLLRIFALMALVKPFGRVFGITIDALGKPQLNFRILMISLAINTILNIFFIRQWQLPGAAWATFVATWVTILMGQYFLSRMFSLPYPQLLKGIGSYYWTVLKTRTFFQKLPD